MEKKPKYPYTVKAEYRKGDIGTQPTIQTHLCRNEAIKLCESIAKYNHGDKVCLNDWEEILSNAKSIVIRCRCSTL